MLSLLWGALKAREKHTPSLPPEPAVSWGWEVACLWTAAAQCWAVDQLVQRVRGRGSTRHPVFRWLQPPCVVSHVTELTRQFPCLPGYLRSSERLPENFGVYSRGPLSASLPRPQGGRLALSELHVLCLRWSSPAPAECEVLPTPPSWKKTPPP